MSVYGVLDRDGNVWNMAATKEMAEHLIKLQPNIVEPYVRKYGVWDEDNYDEFYEIVFAHRK